MMLPAYISTVNPVGRIHLDPTCEGLSGVESVEKIRLHSPRAAARRTLRLPCRRCALEVVLHDLLTRPVGQVPALVAVASIPGHARRGAVPELSETGTARIETLARQPGWTVTPTELGPVAFGVTTRANSRLVARNLYTLTSTPLPHRQRSVVVACAVSVAVGHHGLTAPPLDDGEKMWRIAEALCE